jgi:hypothetical protein
LYNFDGITKTTNVSVGGINEIKYPERNNHESLFNFIQSDANEIIKRGTARIVKRSGDKNR